MDQCKRSNRNWHLQMVTKRFFAKPNEYKFSNPAWYLLTTDQSDKNEDRLNEQSCNVIKFLKQTGGVVQEIFGMTYLDLMDLDRPTYMRIKTAVYEICEQRAKEQEERARQESERLAQEEQARKQRLQTK